jgi:hypothetical protein
MQNAATNGKEERQAPKKRPAHEIRLSGIRASLWANQTSAGTVYNVTLSRLYKDADGNWRSSDSFGRDDLPVLARVVTLAHDWFVYSRKSQEGEQ